MKRILSVLLCFCISVSAINCTVYAIDFNDVTLEETISNVSELLEEQSDSGKAIEESAECRVIVKASRKPLSYGEFDFIECVDDVYIYQYESADIANKALEFYNNQSCVKWAELDGVVEANAEPIPQEPMLQTNDIKDNVLESGEPLEKVVVAVLDTGINFGASVFDGRVVYDTKINLSDSGEQDSAKGDNIHGTNVARIIVNNTNSNVEIFGYKVLNKKGEATNTSVAYGIQAAIEDDVDIINLSLGGSIYSELVYEKIRKANENGIIIVTSSGNTNTDTSNQFPAAFDEVFTVGSIDKNGNHSFFSNYGKEVDFVALGQDVDIGSKRVNGTSFACPAVSAVSAWVLSVAPMLTPDEVKQCLVESCVPYESLAYHDNFHTISYYDTTCELEYKQTTTRFEIGTEDERLYYGYGMPQIIPAIASALDKNTHLDTPVFSLETGTYNEKIVVELTAADGNEIYYTTDESYPSRENGTKYSEPITVTNSMSIRAVAYDKNDLRSFPVACEYKMEFIPDENDFTINKDGVILGYKGTYKEIAIPETIKEIVVTGIAPDALSRMIRLKLPESIKYLDDETFYESSLNFIDAPGVEEIGMDTFYCSPIINCNFPRLKTIGISAFQGTYLRELNLQELTTAGEWAFADMPYLHLVSMPKLKNISYCMFQNCFQLRFADFPLVESVDVNAFSECYFLKKINLSSAKSFTNTYNDNMLATFKLCCNLTNIDLPSALSLNGLCFKSCHYLEEVNLPNAIHIGSNTFERCLSLKNIVLEKTEYIGNRAFYMANLSSEMLLPSVREIAKEAFCNTNLIKLYLPNLEILGEGAFSCINEMTNKYVDNKRFTFFSAPKLKIAKDNAFAYLTALTTLDLPSLVEIGKNAFIGSGVSRAEFSNLETAKSLPVVENSIIALPSTFKECTEDTKGRNYIIYGTEGTYAKTWAEENNHTFVVLNSTNAILEDLPKEYYGLGEVLAPDVIGFNKTYQWYSNDKENNTTGTPIDGATNKEFNPADYPQAKYYYCVVTSRDGNNEPIKIRTGVTKNTTYNVCEHNYEAVITAPTCTENGYTTYTCSACGDTYIADVINAIGHTEVIDNAVAPTCTETGLTEGKHCSVCGETLVEQTVVDALGHKYDSVITEPTCTKEGYTTYTCSACGDTYIADVINAIGHTEVIDNAVAPTCTETGLTEGKHCSVCGETLVEQIVVDVLGHKYDSIITEPTCTKEGYTTYTCSICGDTYTADKVKAIGHTANAPIVENIKDATCTGNGSYDEVIYCSVCGEELSRETITNESLGHTDENGDGVCDTCNEQICTCGCHKTGIVKIIWYIINIILKILGKNTPCACGKIH